MMLFAPTSPKLLTHSPPTYIFSLFLTSPPVRVVHVHKSIGRPKGP